MWHLSRLFGIRCTSSGGKAARHAGLCVSGEKVLSQPVGQCLTDFLRTRGIIPAMTSRQRVLTTLNHEEPDRVPLDLGASVVTGIMASPLSELRLALGLDQPGDRFFHGPQVQCEDLLTAAGNPSSEKAARRRAIFRET